MESKSIADLTKKLSSTGKQKLADSQLLQKLTSPSVALVALSVVTLVAEAVEPKHVPWGSV